MYVKLLLINTLLDNEAYTFLRTKEQLGIMLIQVYIKYTMIII